MGYPIKKRIQLIANKLKGNIDSFVNRLNFVILAVLQLWFYAKDNSRFNSGSHTHIRYLFICKNADVQFEVLAQRD